MKVWCHSVRNWNSYALGNFNTILGPLNNRKVGKSVAGNHTLRSLQERINHRQAIPRRFNRQYTTPRCFLIVLSYSWASLYFLFFKKSSIVNSTPSRRPTWRCWHRSAQTFFPEPSDKSSRRDQDRKLSGNYNGVRRVAGLSYTFCTDNFLARVATGMICHSAVERRSALICAAASSRWPPWWNRV